MLYFDIGPVVGEPDLARRSMIFVTCGESALLPWNGKYFSKRELD